MNSFLPGRADPGNHGWPKRPAGKELIVTARQLPVRSLPERPDLGQLKRQAKELLRALRAGDAGALAEVKAHYRGADAATFALHDAQLVLARAYGFESWPKLKAYVDGATVGRLIEAVRANDAGRARAILKARPELANTDAAENDERRALHHAVLGRLPDMVRLLMEHGADARKGVYPHREATSALTLAAERGYDEIVALIREEEQRRREAAGGSAATAADELCEVIARGDGEAALALLEADSSLVHARHRDGWTPLHAAAALLSERLVNWLLGHGADANARRRDGQTPLDRAAQARGRAPAGLAERFAAVAASLRQHGGELTARSAVALGEVDWLRARHAEGTLANPVEPAGGLLTVAANHDRPDLLGLLLDFGFDPDERVRVGDLEEVVFSWGMPLWYCAGAGRHALAEVLLTRGADPNGLVYASGTPVSQAYARADGKMIALLERHGGVAGATTAGLHRRAELARKMLAGEAGYSLAEDTSAGRTAAEQLLWGAACGGAPDIVKMALEHVDWPREDPRWYGILEQPLRLWSYGVNPPGDRGVYLACFRLVLGRCDANVRGRLGRTMLHEVAGFRRYATADEQVAFAAALLDAGARTDVRDELLQSTPLGWACRWGRVELVKLLLERGADPVEADADPAFTPRAWAAKMGHAAVVAALQDGRR
jgi:ankyrin repeat protein